MSLAQFAIAARAEKITPFHVMELMKKAAALEASGRSIIHMSIGEPDFTAPAPVLKALEAAMSSGRAQYTAAVGLKSLRHAISNHYRDHFSAEIDPERIIITAGASGALLLTMAAIIDNGQEILMPDPSYPCNRHFVSAFNGSARLVPVGAKERFQLTAALVEANWNPNTRGVLITTPSNPTGTSIPDGELHQILERCEAHGGYAIVDEIYQGLSFDGPPKSILADTSPDAPVIVINSFSKYFNMTGWRLGWVVVPQSMVPVFERLAQNLFICASALAQHAALACFEPQTLVIYEERREQFRQRRDYFVPALRQVGFDVPVTPDGAFYVWADCSRFSQDSNQFALDVLEGAGVCIVPGKDFGDADPKRWVRFSYATSMANLQEAIARLTRFVSVRQKEKAA